MKNRLSQISYNLLKSFRFKDSRTYWSDRYRKGGNSGVGSYGRFAEFKARTVNELVREFAIQSMVELGSGDGNQASMFDVPRYVGLDVAEESVALSNARFQGRPGFRSEHYTPASFDGVLKAFRADASISLDVIYHLVENDVYETYLRQLFALADKLVVIYSGNRTTSRLLSGRHVRHRRFTDDVAAIAPGWECVRHIPNPYPPVFLNYGGSMADFYIYRPRNVIAGNAGRE